GNKAWRAIQPGLTSRGRAPPLPCAGAHGRISECGRSGGMVVIAPATIIASGRRVHPVPDWQPDFHCPRTGHRIKVRAIAFKPGRMPSLEPRCRKPLVPDAVKGLVQRRDIALMHEYGVALRVALDAAK